MGKNSRITTVITWYGSYQFDNGPGAVPKGFLFACVRFSIRGQHVVVIFVVFRRISSGLILWHSIGLEHNGNLYRRNGGAFELD